VPPIVKTIDSFNEYWADAIALVNKMAVPALQDGYRMTAMDNDVLLVSYGDLLANFGALYAATQETMKSQAHSLVAKGQLANIQQSYMAVGQQSPSGIYAPAQQQCMFNNCNKRNGGGQGSSQGFLQQPTMTLCSTGGSQQQALRPPTPYRHWKNWNYCHTHSGDVDNTHTSTTCGKPGPMHNPNASRANIMGRLVARMHKTILPLACGHTTPPNHRPQQQQLPQQCPPIAYYPPGGTAWQQPTPPMQVGRMPPASGIYRQQTTMAMRLISPSK
jgi:hypothetical protein